MAERRSGVHVVTTERRYKDRVYRAHLLRRSYREDGKVKKETLGNITALGDDLVAVVRAGLQGQQVGVLDAVLPPVRSRPHGHVRAIARAMERLGIARLSASRASRERSIILALICQRVLSPGCKPACTRRWHATSVADVFDVANVRVDEAFDAMDWLAQRQEAIEGRLAERHLTGATPLLFGLSSRYVEGTHNELAAFGHDRDRKRGKRQVNHGILTDAIGRPVALRVFAGKSSDAAAVRALLPDLRAQFGLREVVLVGDRGMITSAHARELQEHDPSLQWISALRAKDIRQLMLTGALQASSFEQDNLVEFASAGFPGERLVACRNPLSTAKRAHHRETSSREAASDGIYVIRSNTPAASRSAAELVRAYKDLRYVEQLFRSLKGVDLAARPIHHRKADRTTAHPFICLLAYYVRWHLERAWATLTYRDHDPLDDNACDPVAPAERSDAAERKAARHTTASGDPAHSFKALLESLGTIVRNTHQHPQTGATITLDTIPTAHQQHALELVETINP